MKRSVYAIVSGSYEDYQVHCLYETREDAQAAIGRLTSRKAFSGGLHPDPEIQEFDMYSPGDTSFRARNRWGARCQVRLDGTIEPLSESRPFTEAADHDSEPYELVNRLLSVYIVSVHAPDREQAEKAVRERAVEVAALIHEGVDPCAVKRGQ